MEQGTQIAYVPSHAGGNLFHPDVEFGFVVSERGDAHFCRYWRKGCPGKLRTLANSELTPTVYLVKTILVRQAVIRKCLRRIAEEQP